MQIDEPIIICNYDPTWVQRFEEEKAVILRAVEDLIVELEHFGSTAVPGLAAKPVVDILVGLKQYPIPDDAIQAFEQIGYEYFGEADVCGRLYFRKRKPSAFNLGAVEWGSKLWRDNLLLRDYLRCHPEARQRYEQHKRTTIIAGYNQLLAYSNQKAQLVLDLLEQAEEWAKRPEWGIAAQQHDGADS
ncbi:GrpB family protein [Chlorogloeopsis sp. ULAP01]|uniref:GrpB family protein n=1 Tax=Chlorogloeopsis sp. ULAP01 TaxID=3056483 RepID=UPI0025AA43CE|nr:GrpB family protein [Chlorogloeopsis sp. ULAP01]MDM9385387.1 GrpB family protein [Chlorogloeopsis sp. ULAP01]